jgi:hypothetical protein
LAEGTGAPRRALRGTGSAAIAAVALLRKQGQVKNSERRVAPLTASGLNDPDTTAAVLGDRLTVPSDVKAAFAKLREVDAFLANS